jgi:hypothetical protein
MVVHVLGIGRAGATKASRKELRRVLLVGALSTLTGAANLKAIPPIVLLHYSSADRY